MVDSVPIMSMTPPPDATEVPRRRSATTTIIVILLAICGTCGVGMFVLAVIFLPTLTRAAESRKRNLGVTRMRSVVSANLMYATDNDDSLPIADAWMDSVSKYVGSPRDFRSPDLPRFSRGAFGIAFMSSLSSAKVKSIPNSETSVLTFDSTLMARNSHSGLETVPKPPRFGVGEMGGNVFSFVDGHAKMLTAVEEASLKQFKPGAPQ